jgi:hypothetical protein
MHPICAVFIAPNWLQQQHTRQTGIVGTSTSTSGSVEVSCSIIFRDSSLSSTVINQSVSELSDTNNKDKN